MDLNDWLLNNLAEFGKLVVWFRVQGRGNSGAKIVRSIDQYNDLVNESGDNYLGYTCYNHHVGLYYYILWDGTKGYKFKINTRSVYGRALNSYFYGSIFGHPDWKDNLRSEYPELLESCGNCTCYNDYLVTGWCNGKMKDISVWN